MIQPGKKVKSDSGKQIRAEALIKVGGQGEAYEAKDLNTGEMGVLKVFSKRFANEDTRTRIRFLLEQELEKECPALCAPTDLIDWKGILGHYAPMAPGASMEELLKNPNFNFPEALQLGTAIAHAVSILHHRNIAHGDIHSENFIIERKGAVLTLQVIDFDNFNAPGMPKPPMVGQNLYLAPEIRNSMASGKPTIPDMGTDRFSLGVLMHELILLKHVATGADDCEEAFQEAMCEGKWRQDPARTLETTEDQNGYPAGVLNADLARLFRKSMSLVPGDRPSPADWKSELGKAMNALDCCPMCGGPCIIDASKTHCPLCKKPYPHLSLIADGDIKLSLNRGSLSVGRSNLNASKKVSVCHAVFRRFGPETWLEPLGRNGTYRWSGGKWIRLPDGKPVLVQGGDRIRLADVEAKLS